MNYAGVDRRGGVGMVVLGSSLLLLMILVMLWWYLCEGRI